MTNIGTDASKSKVLMVGPASPSTGGISTYIDELLSSKLRDYFFFESLDPLVIKNRFGKQESRVSLREISSGLKVIKAFVDAMNKFNPDLVHIHTSSHWGFYEKSLLSLISKYIFRKKTIIHIHGGEFGLFYKRAVSKSLIDWLLSQANKTLIVSKSIKEELGLKKCVLVDNCVRFDDTALFTNKDAIRKRYDIPSGKTVFLSAALFMEKKGICETLIIFHEIHKKRDDFYFIVAGEGSGKNKIITFVRTNNLGANVKVMDYITDQHKKDIFLLSDVFILNSTVESFGISLIEAVAQGLFVITTTVGIASNAENLFNDSNCMRVPIKDKKALKEAILKVLDKKINIKAINEENFYNFKKRFEEGIVINRMKTIYEEVLD